jgi:hypothetical protein
MMKERYNVLVTDKDYDYIYDQIENKMAILEKEETQKRGREIWDVVFSDGLVRSIRIVYDSRDKKVITVLRPMAVNIRKIKSRKKMNISRKIYRREEYGNETEAI